jgi:molecular chaperone DnaK
VGEGVFQVLSTNGDTFLGGDDFDQRIINWVADEFKKDQGIDLRSDRMALQRLKEAAEKAKIELSTVMQTDINLPFITADASGPKHLQLALSRSKLEQLTGDLIARTVEPLKQALGDAKLSTKDIAEAILVGGMTRMPAVQEAVRKHFGREPHKGVNPDEVVAIGAAIQAGVLGGQVKDILLLDVTPLTLSIETLGGIATPMIERNTTIPTKKTQIFSTAADSQTEVEVVVTQGERPMARDNKLLGNFRLTGLPPAPRGMPQIEVTFDIDADGILHVGAKDKATGREQGIKITASSGLSKDQVGQMVHDAELHAEEDKRRQADIEARNRADNAHYQVQKFLQDNQSKLPDDIKRDLQDKMDAVKAALDRDSSAEELDRAVDAMNNAWQQAGARMYQQSGDATPPPGETDGSGDAGPSDSGGEDVVDGEYRNV